jgi:methylation protein EvaC
VTDRVGPAPEEEGRCRVCGGTVREFLDLGRQPLSDNFLAAGELENEFFFRLSVGFCESCTMVQLGEVPPREKMFHDDYPYYSSGSSVMRKHFEQTAREFLETELTGEDPFIVEIGCNDGVMLKTVHDAGVRHLGFEPSGKVAEVARGKGVRVTGDFFEESTAAAIRAADGPADVIFAANTICHIPYMDSILKGVDALLGPGGVFVFEDPYLGEIVSKTSFDQIYDEHCFLFSAHSVAETARRFGLALVDVRRLGVHGGEIRYTLARAGEREPTADVAALLAEEDERGLAEPATLERFAANVVEIRDVLVTLLRRLKDEGRTVVAYGATAKSATVTNFCGIGPDLVSYVCDTTPAKQDRLTPGAHLPVRPASAFADPYPDYALLFAWNHAEEIMAKEQDFRRSGGRWIVYVPKVRVI